MNTDIISQKYRYGEHKVFQKQQGYDFGYSDGENSETRLLNALQNCSDVSLFSTELMQLHRDWASFYHLTPLRANLLRPFIDIIKSGPVLELGAGCGAVTRFLGELGNTVVAVEGSSRRAEIIAERCRDLPNVSVVSDLIQEFDSPIKFKLVTLIGVLEYAQVYVDSPDPIQELITKAKQHLDTDGILLIAIENQLGLKYLCGSPEDHLGISMFGINDAYSEKSAITFGKKELAQKVLRAGLAHTTLYIPLPDYKTPVTIAYPGCFSDAASTAGFDLAALFSGSVVHDRQNARHPTFSLENAWQVVARNGLAPDLANSFLLLASNQKLDGSDVIAAHYGCQRPAAFAKETQFLLIDEVVYTRTRSIAPTSILDTPDWQPAPYRTGRLWFDELLKITNRPKWSLNDLQTWTKVWIQALADSQPSRTAPLIPELSKFQKILPSNFIDATPTNLILSASGKADFFDLEWNFSTPLPIEFIVFRGLFLTLHRMNSCARPAEDVPMRIFDITMLIMGEFNMQLDADDIDLFVTLFNAFQNQAQGLPQNVLNPLTQALETAQLPVRQLFT